MNNKTVSTSCSDANEQVVVSKASPSLTTNASPTTATAGNSIADIAHLTGGTNPTGSITFPLYSDASCTVSVFTSTKTVSGNGDYTSDSYIALAGGIYHWVASYSGDLN